MVFLYHNGFIIVFRKFQILAQNQSEINNLLFTRHNLNVWACHIKQKRKEIKKITLTSLGMSEVEFFLQAIQNSLELILIRTLNLYDRKILLSWKIKKKNRWCVGSGGMTSLVLALNVS